MYEEIKRQERELQRRPEIEEKLKQQELLAILAKKNEKDGNVRLPKLELRKFKGDLMQWTEFWEQYRVSIHINNNLGTLEKFTYLKGNLEGPPLTTIGPLALTEENYEKAIGMLEDRYGRPDKIQEAHLRMMEEISPIFEASDKKRLGKFQEMIEGHQKGLEAVGIEPKSYEMIMVPKLMRKLLLLIRTQIAKSRKVISKPLTWKEFMEALKKEVTILEDCKEEKRDETPRYDCPKRKERKSEEKSRTWTTGKSLLVSKRMVVLIVWETMNLEVARRSLQLTKRQEILRRYKRCFGCLRKGHFTHDCKRKHVNVERVITISSFVKSLYQLLLWELGNQTLWIEIVHQLLTNEVLVKVSDLGNSSEVTCHAMLDPASGGTYMTQRLADRLSCGSKGKKTSTLEGIMKKGSTVTSETCDILVKSMNGRYQKKFKAKTLPVITAVGNPKPLQLKAEYENLEGIYFNDVCHDKHLEVEILIGLEDLPDILTGRNRKGKPGEPMAIETEFGWTILGPTGGAGTSKESALLVIETEPDIHDNLKCMWDLETVGIREEDPVHEAFQEEIVFTGE